MSKMLELHNDWMCKTAFPLYQECETCQTSRSPLISHLDYTLMQTQQTTIRHNCVCNCFMIPEMFLKCLVTVDNSCCAVTQTQYKPTLRLFSA